MTYSFTDSIQALDQQLIQLVYQRRSAGEKLGGWLGA